MEWSTEKPTEPGWYWAWAHKWGGVKVLEFCHYTRGYTGRDDEPLQCFGSWGSERADLYTHFRGPLETPLPPALTAISKLREKWYDLLMETVPGEKREILCMCMRDLQTLEDHYPSP